MRLGMIIGSIMFNDNVLLVRLGCSSPIPADHVTQETAHMTIWSFRNFSTLSPYTYRTINLFVVLIQIQSSPRLRKFPTPYSPAFSFVHRIVPPDRGTSPIAKSK